MGFGIGSKGYMGTGTTDVNSRAAAKKDMWEYDPTTDTWTQKADFGGSPRSSITAFTIGDMGYTAFGSDTTNATFGKTHDFWRYDPATDTWTQKADFAGGNRNSPTGFGLPGSGYMGMGIPDTSAYPQHPTSGSMIQPQTPGPGSPIFPAEAATAQIVSPSARKPISAAEEQEMARR